MATVSATPRRPSATNPVLVPTRLRRPRRPPRIREQRLADARAREVRARHDLAQTFARMERTYALAVRDLEEFDAHLSGVRQHLQHAGYLAAAGRRGRTP